MSPLPDRRGEWVAPHDGLQNPHLDEDIQPLALTEGAIDSLGAALFPGVRAVSIADQGLRQATVLATRENTGRSISSSL